MHILSVIGDTSDHLKIVNMLLEHGSNIGVQTNHGYTPIMYACMSPPHADVILKILLDEDKDCQALNLQNIYGHTALHLMIKSGNMDRLTLILSYKPNLDLQDNEGNTPLMFATKIGFVEAVHALIDAGANPNITNMYREGAYHFACNRVMENDDDILMILSENKGEERYALTRLGWIIPPQEYKINLLGEVADQNPTSRIRHKGYLYTMGDKRRETKYGKYVKLQSF